jgi:RNA methyltransferase, TrmH family
MPALEHEHITSNKNQHVQHIRELLAKKTTREQSGYFVVEGVRLCEEAINQGVQPKLVMYSKTCSERGIHLVRQAQEAGAKVLSVEANILNTLSDTETAQGLLMVVPDQIKTLPEKLDFVVIVDQLRDPGNFGTILRSAVAAGAQAVFCTPGSVDAWSPKVVRSAMGAHFHIPIVKSTWKEIHKLCKSQEEHLTLFLAESGGGIALWQADLKQPVALVIGGEADGAIPEVKADVDTLLNIPMPGGFESLNAAVAASVILFEVVRQRAP